MTLTIFSRRRRSSTLQVLESINFAGGNQEFLPYAQPEKACLYEQCKPLRGDVPDEIGGEQSLPPEIQFWGLVVHRG